MNLNNLKNTGAYIKESLPNIRGYFKPRSGNDGIDTNDKTETGGAFTKNIWFVGNSVAQGRYNFNIIWYEFNANRSNNIYQDNANIHPLSFTVSYCIKY